MEESEVHRVAGAPELKVGTLTAFVVTLSEARSRQVGGWEVEVGIEG